MISHIPFCLNPVVSNNPYPRWKYIFWAPTTASYFTKRGGYQMSKTSMVLAPIVPAVWLDKTDMNQITTQMSVQFQTEIGTVRRRHAIPWEQITEEVDLYTRREGFSEDVGAGSWGTGRNEKAGQSRCTEGRCAWSRGRGQARPAPEDYQTGFCIYSRSSGKWGIMKGLKERSGRFMGFSVENGLNEAREIDKKALRSFAVV